jgi:hypothetical protein
MLSQVELSAGLALAAALPAAALGWLASYRFGNETMPALLSWDGRAWALDGQSGELSIAIDLTGWMLLRFDHHGRPGVRWLPLSLRAAGPSVTDCRAVLHAHAGAARSLSRIAGPWGDRG